MSDRPSRTTAAIPAAYCPGIGAAARNKRAKYDFKRKAALAEASRRQRMAQQPPRQGDSPNASSGALQHHGIAADADVAYMYTYLILCVAESANGFRGSKLAGIAIGGCTT
jgi:hypothetical protein